MGDHSRHWRGALPFVLLRDQQVCPAAKLLDEMRGQAKMSELILGQPCPWWDTTV